MLIHPEGGPPKNADAGVVHSSSLTQFGSERIHEAGMLALGSCPLTIDQKWFLVSLLGICFRGARPGLGALPFNPFSSFLSVYSDWRQERPPGRRYYGEEEVFRTYRMGILKSWCERNFKLGPSPEENIVLGYLVCEDAPVRNEVSGSWQWLVEWLDGLCVYLTDAPGAKCQPGTWWTNAPGRMESDLQAPRGIVDSDPITIHMPRSGSRRSKEREARRRLNEVLRSMRNLRSEVPPRVVGSKAGNKYTKEHFEYLALKICGIGPTAIGKAYCKSKSAIESGIADVVKRLGMSKSMASTRVRYACEEPGQPGSLTPAKPF